MFNKLIDKVRKVWQRIGDWLWESHMADYDREILDQVEREVCEPCPEKEDCIGPVPMWGGVFPCRRAGERYWEIEAEKEENECSEF